MVTKLKTAHDQPHIVMAGGYRKWIEQMAAKTAPRRVVNWQTGGRPLAAYVLRGMWVVSCPDCPETILWEPGEPFYCINCHNAGNGGRARPVRLPKRRADIEALLLARPHQDNRNWRPPETVDRLQSENRLYGGLS